jgi:hypothetical protein
MGFFIVAQDKTNPLNLSQLLRRSLSIATSSHHQSVRVSAMSQSEPVAGFGVSDMSNSAGVQYIDIGLIGQ